MCRFVAYIGKKNILLADILIKPKNSLVKQSLLSSESRTITNGDGFGVGWYTEFAPTPALFTSLFPAWNDQNLSYLARKTKAPLFFGHVRAASTGGISQFNCHPFLYKNWMFMHNGWIPHFDKIKRQIHQMLDNDIYNWVKGSTDSELIFALFLQLVKKADTKNWSEVTATLAETLTVIDSLVKENNKRSVSHFNICLTDGKRLVAFRYCTSKNIKPETMYVSRSKNLIQNNFPNTPKDVAANCIVIASEKLTKSGLEWQAIPPNHCLMVDADLTISLQKIR